jgi:diguanylate cyclase (GGDEF)-like protein
VSPFFLLVGGAAVGAVAGFLFGRRSEREKAEERAADERPVVVPGLRMPVEPTLEGILRLLVDEAGFQVDVVCAVALREHDGGPIKVRAISSGGDPRLVGREVDILSLAGRIVTEGVPVVEQTRHPLVGTGTGDRRRPITGSLGVPLVAGPRVFGALMAFGEPAIGPTTALSRLDPLARGYAPVLLPALAADIEERRAHTDPLTDLPNRRGFDKAMARLGDSPRALICIDIDHFKAVNDERSHAAGDSVLRQIGRLLREAVRDGDTPARIGGEEFAVILPGGDLALGVEVAERLRTQVAGRRFFADGAELTLTISCGVAAAPVPIPQPANLMASADSCLYQAKRAGRNQVKAAEQRGRPSGPRQVAEPPPPSPWVGPLPAQGVPAGAEGPGERAAAGGEPAPAAVDSEARPVAVRPPVEPPVAGPEERV